MVPALPPQPARTETAIQGLTRGFGLERGRAVDGWNRPGLPRKPIAWTLGRPAPEGGVACLRAQGCGDGSGQPCRVPLQGPATVEYQAFVVIDGEVVPQQVADPVEVDPGA